LSADAQGHRLRAGLVGAELVFWRVVLPVLRRTVKLERLVRAIATSNHRPREPGLERFAIRAAARLWRSADGPCLERSLALYRVLGRAGAGPMLVCGMAQGAGGLVGHAWVEIDGLPIVDSTSSAEQYTVVTRYSADGSRVAQPSPVGA
jgi:hypothetical protein